MTNRLTKRSRTTYVPAVAAQPGRPAYCVTTTGDSVKYVNVSSLNSVGVQQIPGYPVIVKSHLDATGRQVIDGYQVPVLMHNVQITTCYPAVAAVAGREAAVVTDGQVGWNSGARSIDTLSGDFDLTFSLPPVPSGAVICGIAANSAAVGPFESIEHGLFKSGGVIKFYESGVEKHSFSAVATDQPSLKIRRTGGVVTAFVAGESFRSGTRSTGQKSVLAALYAAGDFVDAPAVAAVFSGSSFSPLSLGGESPSSRDSTLMAGSASGRDNGGGSAPVIGLDGVVTVFDMAMSAVGRGIFHDIGVSSADVSPRLNSSEEFQAVVRLLLEDPNVSGYDTGEMLSLSITEGLIPQSTAEFPAVLFASIVESLTLGSVIDIVFGLDARLYESLALPDSASANMVLEAVLRSGISMSDFSSQARNQAIQYATNIATGAVTRYSGFGFSSFCRVGSQLWATKPDGLYKIGGADDDGELLSFLIDFAADDQGSARTKRLESIFFGLTTDGRVVARLTDDFGRQYTYRLIQRDSSEARIETSKGASSRFWKLRLEGDDASYAELDNIEWVSATGARRTKR